MLARFGTDKPDLRYGMELADLAVDLRRNGLQRVRGVLATEGGAIKGLAAPGGGQLSRKSLDQLVQDEGPRRGRSRLDRRRGRRRALPGGEAPLSDEIDGVLRSDRRASGDLSASWPTGRPGARGPRRRAPAPGRSTSI